MLRRKNILDEKKQKQEAKPKTGEDQKVKAASAKDAGGVQAKPAAQSQPKPAAPKAAEQSQPKAAKESKPASVHQQNAQNDENTYDAAKDANDNKMMAIFCYLWILVLVPLLSGAHKTSQFIKFHVNQGLVLFIFWAAYWVIVLILQIVLINVGLVWIVYFFWLLWLLPTIYGIIGIINAANGKCQPLPLIGKIKIIK